MLLANECYSSTRSKLYVCDLIWMRSPTHITCDHMTVAKNPFDHGYVPCAIRTFYPGLEVYNGSISRSAGNAPTELVSTSRPLPGISIGSPRYIYAMQLVVTLIGPPCATGIGERITGTSAYLRCLGMPRAYVYTQASSQEKQAKYCYHTYLNYKTNQCVLLEIVPCLLM